MRTLSTLSNLHKVEITKAGQLNTQTKEPRLIIKENQKRKKKKIKKKSVKVHRPL